MKVFEAKVASMEAQHRIDNAKMRALEQRTSFHLVGLGLSFGLGLLLFKWMGKA